MKKQIIAIAVIIAVLILALGYEAYVVYQDHKQIAAQNQNWVVLNQNFAQAVISVINQAISQTATTTKK